MVYMLVKNHPCFDGNKRLAAILLWEFLALNGRELCVESGALARAIISVASSDPAERAVCMARLSSWMGRRLVLYGQASKILGEQERRPR